MGERGDTFVLIVYIIASDRELIFDFFQRRRGSLENASFSKKIFLHRLFMGNKTSSGWRYHPHPSSSGLCSRARPAPRGTSLALLLLPWQVLWGGLDAHMDIGTQASPFLHL